MKRTIHLIMALCIGAAAFAQVPNGGFENWTGTEPDNWGTNNIATFDLYPITQSSDAHSGTSAIRGEVILNTSSGDEVYNPILNANQFGFPVSQDHAGISGWYQFNPVQATASFIAQCILYDINYGVKGYGNIEITEATSGYTEFTMPFEYTSTNPEPTAYIVVAISLSDEQELSAIGSWFLLDDLVLEAPTSVQENDMVNAEVGLPYPIPFLDQVTIPITVESNSYFKVEVIDLVGRTVEVLNNEIMPSGAHLINWTPSESISNGVYFIRISGDEGSASRRVILER